MGYSDIAFDRDSVFLVTGGAGFIGSNLCEALLKKGCKVKCLDNLSTGKREMWIYSSEIKITVSLKAT